VRFGKFIMSRIGKQPIKLPDNVEVSVAYDTISVKGPKGELSQLIHPEVDVEITDKEIIVRRKKEGNSSAVWGLMRALIANMVQGVSEGFQKSLEIEGVGYRAQLQGDKLILRLGFSHDIELLIPESIAVNVEGNTVQVSGIDKQLVGQIAARIRAFKKPEPYKGKGIHYVGEYVRRKAGKKAATV